MRFQLVGIQRVDMKTEKDEVHGNKLHGVILDEQSSSVTGQKVDTVWVPDDSKLGRSNVLMELTIGETYDVYFGKGSKMAQLIVPASD